MLALVWRSKRLKDNDFSDKIFGIFFFFKFALGSWEFFVIYFVYVHLLILPHKKKPHRCDSCPPNFLLTPWRLYSGVPNILSSFGVSPEMGDIGCKAVVYIQRVTFSISLYTTSLQSTFQAVTITLINSKWVWLKIKMLTFIQPSLLFPGSSTWSFILRSS